MVKEYYTDYVRRFYVDGSDGACITVENDDDDFGLVDIKTKDKKDSDYFGSINVCLTPSQTRALAKLLIEAADAIEQMEKE